MRISERLDQDTLDLQKTGANLFETIYRILAEQWDGDYQGSLEKALQEVSPFQNMELKNFEMPEVFMVNASVFLLRCIFLVTKESPLNHPYRVALNG